LFSDNLQSPQWGGLRSFADARADSGRSPDRDRIGKFDPQRSFLALGLNAGVDYRGLDGIGLMYVLKQQYGGQSTWLVSVEPQSWGERDRAMRFETRQEARRAAVEIKLSGDWSIEPAGTASLRLE
jgi:hypothetical protein